MELRISFPQSLRNGRNSQILQKRNFHENCGSEDVRRDNSNGSEFGSDHIPNENVSSVNLVGINTELRFVQFIVLTYKIPHIHSNMTWRLLLRGPFIPKQIKTHL